jgi:PiT family inorganic phosphate transporter
METAITLQNILIEIQRSPILLVSVLLTLGVIFVNGWTDAPNAIATAVSTRSINVDRAIAMAAVCNFVGVVVMTYFNSSVSFTIKNMVNF